MDALSEVLRVVRLSGVIHLRAELTEPWAIASSPPLLAARLKVASEALAVFHVVTEGCCFVCTDKLPPVRVEAGDVIVFPRGDAHTVASDPALQPTAMKDIYPNPSLSGVADLKHGGQGKLARIVCGFLH